MNIEPINQQFSVGSGRSEKTQAAVLELVRSGTDLKGFATYHGGLKTPEGQDYSKTKGEVQVMHGSADAAITMDQFVALTNQFRGCERKTRNGDRGWCASRFHGVR